jgi:Tfp pilus assembly protein PilF
VVRATALTLLSHYPGDMNFKTFEKALVDPDSLVRHTAVRQMPVVDQKTIVRLFVPMLYDPAKAVRIQAAMNLTAIPPKQLTARQRELFEAVLTEYQLSLEYVGDFPQGRFNLGNMYVNLGQPEKAETNYKAAIEIDNLFYPAKVNLAMHYNRTGRNDDAEKFLREVISEHPELYEASYSLGLLLVEQKKPNDAVRYLRKAAEGMPTRARVHYNLGLLLQQLKRLDEAERYLLRALQIEPDSMDYLFAVADHYIKRRKLAEAKRVAELMISKHPSNDLGRRLLRVIEQMRLKN